MMSGAVVIDLVVRFGASALKRGCTGLVNGGLHWLDTRLARLAENVQFAVMTWNADHAYSIDNVHKLRVPSF